MQIAIHLNSQGTSERGQLTPECLHLRPTNEVVEERESHTRDKKHGRRGKEAFPPRANCVKCGSWFVHRQCRVIIGPRSPSLQRKAPRGGRTVPSQGPGAGTVGPGAEKNPYAGTPGPDSAATVGGRGNRTRKVLPLPGVLVTRISPPWLSTMPWTTDRPNPVP